MQLKCTICHNSMEPQDNNAGIPCGHLFHFSCLTNWLQRSKTCPQCRAHCTFESVHAVFFNVDTDAAEAMDKSLKAEIETLVNSVQVLSSSLNDRMDSLEKLVTQSLLAKESKTAQCLPSNGTNLIQTIHAANIVKAEPSNATQWFPTFPPSSIVKTEPSAQSSSVSSAPTQFLLKPAAIIQNANEPTKKAFDFEDSSGRYTLINPFLSTRTASTVQSRSPRRYTQNPSVPQLKRPVPAFNVIPSTALQGNASKFNAEKFTWNNLKK